MRYRGGLGRAALGIVISAAALFLGPRSRDIPAPRGALRPLILDKRVAAALRAWNLRPSTWPDTGWSTDQYAWYLDYAQRQCDEPEQVERSLFRAGARGTESGDRPAAWSPA